MSISSGFLLGDLHEAKISVSNHSFKIPAPDSKKEQEDHATVLSFLAKNVKMGPWKTTAINPQTGQPLTLAYYLNAATNFLDFRVARLATLSMLRLLRGAHVHMDRKDSGRLLAIGPEMAGGVIAGQIACFVSEDDPFEFVYMRKNRKTSGTLQQLEGPNNITTRTSDSPPISAVWIDDVISTGSSLMDAVVLMKQEYNIEVRAAIFLVDRSRDRRTRACEKLNNKVLNNVKVSAAFDLEDIDVLIPKDEEPKAEEA